jgi:hypothetical protein
MRYERGNLNREFELARCNGLDSIRAKKNGPKGSHLFRPVSYECTAIYSAQARRQELLWKKVFVGERIT